MIKYFNADSFKNKLELKTAPSGFEYGFIANIFKEDVYSRLIKTFPDVKTFKLVDKQSGGGRKRFFTGPMYDANKHSGCVCHLSGLPEIWKNVLNESASPEFIKRLKEQIGIDFNTMCTLGLTYGNEGCMQESHVDGAVREENAGLILSTVACLLYFNEKPDNTSGTCIYAPDRTTVLFRAPSMRNGLFFFEQHPDAWHGFPLMGPGLERRLVSLAYSRELKPLDINTSLQHKLTCVLRYKAIAKKLLK